MTYNIRTSLAEDPGEGNWDFRKQELVTLIRNHYPDLIGIQEPEPLQRLYIMEQLGHPWVSFPELNIIYRKDKFIPLETGKIQLSPDIWGERWAWWVRFRSVTRRDFLFINTHWGVSEESQQHSSEILSTKLKELTQNWQLPTIFLGDFNITPDSLPMATLLNNSPLVSYFTGTTFGGWNADHESQLDYILGTKFTPTKCRADYYREGELPPSDHAPIICEFK